MADDSEDPITEAQRRLSIARIERQLRDLRQQQQTPAEREHVASGGTIDRGAFERARDELRRRAGGER